MFRETNHSTTKAVIELIRTLPDREQKVIAKTLAEPKKKLSAREKKKQEVLNGIAEGFREIKEARRGGKQLMDLDDALNEL
jgi:hypothetical protein